jgi:hypothetical protein
VVPEWQECLYNVNVTQSHSVCQSRLMGRPIIVPKSNCPNPKIISRHDGRAVEAVSSGQTTVTYPSFINMNMPSSGSASQLTGFLWS